MKGQSYSEDFKKAAVVKYLTKGNRPGKLVLQDLGISNSTIFAWIKKYGNTQDMNKKSQRPQDRSGAEKLQLVITYFSLAEADRGKFLREQGLHSAHLEQWKSQFEGFQETASKRSETAEDKRKIKELEKELRRKEKALAETAALLVLKKKADLIWGTEDDE